MDPAFAAGTPARQTRAAFPHVTAHLATPEPLAELSTWVNAMTARDPNGALGLENVASGSEEALNEVFAASSWGFLRVVCRPNAPIGVTRPHHRALPAFSQVRASNAAGDPAQA